MSWGGGAWKVEDELNPVFKLVPETYDVRPFRVLFIDNIHDGVDVKLEVVLLVDGEVLVGVVPVSDQGDLVLVISGPQCDGWVMLKPADLQTNLAVEPITVPINNFST